jgi:hypothetical protein
MNGNITWIKIGSHTNSKWPRKSSAFLPQMKGHLSAPPGGAGISRHAIEVLAHCVHNCVLAASISFKLLASCVLFSPRFTAYPDAKGEQLYAFIEGERRTGNRRPEPLASFSKPSKQNENKLLS